MTTTGSLRAIAVAPSLGSAAGMRVTAGLRKQKYLYTAWWLPLIPGIAISLLVMASNLVGDWLRDRLDPTRRQL
jgi:ABC-type dipeptide/oligopeptide/nickel transport system permease subunit